MRRCLGVLGTVLLIVSAGNSLKADLGSARSAYEQGDYATALDEFRRLAEKGNPEAQFYLGSMYRKSHGVPTDNAEAVKWFYLAAREGHAKAQFNLGFMYYNGLGVEQNRSEALKWYRLAATKGDPWAQNNLGLMYRDGRRADRDYVEAYKWLSLAAAQGFVLARKNRDDLASEMTAGQIDEAEKMAESFEPK